jgi:chromosome segregation ATPase
MFKKLAFLALIVVGAIAALKTPLVQAWVHNAKESCRKHVTAETKIDLMKAELTKLDKDINKHFDAVAKEEYDVRKTRRQIAQAKQDQKELFTKIQTMKEDLQNTSSEYLVYGGERFTVARVEKKLKNDWESYKRGQAELENLEKALEARESALLAVQGQYDTLKSKRKELEVQIVQLEAELKNVRLAQSRTNTDFDDSRFGKIQKMMEEVREEIEVQKIRQEMQGKYTSDDIPVGKKTVTTDELFKEIDAAAKDKGKVVTAGK